MDLPQVPHTPRPLASGFSFTFIKDGKNFDVRVYITFSTPSKEVKLRMKANEPGVLYVKPSALDTPMTYDSANEHDLDTTSVYWSKYNASSSTSYYEEYRDFHYVPVPDGMPYDKIEVRPDYARATPKHATLEIDRSVNFQIPNGFYGRLLDKARLTVHPLPLETAWLVCGHRDEEKAKHFLAAYLAEIEAMPSDFNFLFSQYGLTGKERQQILEYHVGVSII